MLFGIDCDSFKSTYAQAFYIVDDEQKIYHITNGINGEAEEYEVDYEMNFKHHNLQKEMRSLVKHNWTTVHISKRAITFNRRTYSLNSKLNYDISIPNSPGDS